MSGFGAVGAPVAPIIDGWTHIRTGKVRDLYSNDEGEILLVAFFRFCFSINSISFQLDLNPVKLEDDELTSHFFLLKNL